MLKNCRLWYRTISAHSDRAFWTLFAVPPFLVSCSPTHLALRNYNLLFRSTMATDWISWEKGFPVDHAGYSWNLVD